MVLTVIIVLFPLPSIFKVLNANSYDEHKPISFLEQLEKGSTNTALLENIEYRLYLAQSVLYAISEFYVEKENITREYLLNIMLNRLSNKYTKINFEENAKYYNLQIAEKKFNITKQNSHLDLIKIIISISLKIDELHKQNNIKEEGIVTTLNALLQSLDLHSMILNQEEFKSLKEGTEGVFAGLGIIVRIEDQLLTVTKPLPNSPASLMGILKGDKIVAIDGYNTYGYSLAELVEIMRGKPHTTVELSLLRQGSPTRIKINIERDVIFVNPVSANILKVNNKEYLSIKIDNFSERTFDEVKSSIDQFKNTHQNKVNGLMIDLRSNPGGLLKQAIKVSNLFLKEGVIVKTKGHFNDTEYANSTTGDWEYPIALLIDKDTASAGEIVTGALKNNGRAVVVGQNSFGKASVQTLFELPQNQALKLTIAHYYTPDEQSIQGTGISPNIYLHPLNDHGENSNLLGFNRYPQKSYYKNTYNNNSKNDYYPMLNGYYIRGDSHASERLKQDYEMQTALLLLDKMSNNWSSYAQTKNKEYFNLQIKKLKETLDKKTTEVVALLEEKYQVDWSIQQKSKNPKLNISQAFIEDHQVEPGKAIKIHFKIQNRSETDVGRISLFFRHKLYNVVTKEFLLGSIKAHKSLTKTIELNIANSTEPGILAFDIGLAVDGYPLLEPIHTIKLEVLEGRYALLQTKAYLVNEDGGKIIGKLESTEYAKLKIDIKNSSNIAAEDIIVKVINLAGSQVEVTHGSRHIGLILPGEKASVVLDIMAPKNIISSTLPLGLFINAHSLKKPIQKPINIASIPATKTLE